MTRILAALFLCLATFASPARAADLTVFAAASLTNAMKDVAAAWQKQGGVPVHLSLDSSSTLARQLEQACIRTATLHSNRSQNQRVRALKDFKSGAVRVREHDEQPFARNVRGLRYASQQRRHLLGPEQAMVDGQENDVARFARRRVVRLARGAQNKRRGRQRPMNAR